jgi:hypothetical protein
MPSPILVVLPVTTAAGWLPTEGDPSSGGVLQSVTQHAIKFVEPEIPGVDGDEVVSGPRG